MKKVLSVLGAATAVVLLAPWKVTKEEGETRLSALTWEASIGRSENGSLSFQVKPCLNDPRTLLGGEAASYTADDNFVYDAAPVREAETEAPQLDPEEAADYADVDLPDAPDTPDSEAPESEEEQA